MKKIFLTIIFCLFFTFSAHAATLIFQNCFSGVWIGTAIWEGKPGIGVGYSTDNDIELKGHGLKVFTVEPGWYGITIFEPGTQKILDYVDVHVTEDKAVSVKFCP